MSDLYSDDFVEWQGAMITKGEAEFRRAHGHSSLCNCIRKYRGRLLVNSLRRCTCWAASQPEVPSSDAALNDLLAGGSKMIGPRSCPFCGEGRSRVAVYQDDGGYWRVSCGACGASSGIRPPSDPEGREKVLAGWNERKDERQMGWMLSQVGYYFMIGIEPDGRIRRDGGHSDPAEVAKAKRLHESISCIKPPTGTRFYMIRIEEIPDARTNVNEEAIATLNAN